MQERWKLIPGFDDAYEVSSLGRVRRIKQGVNQHRKIPFVLKQSVSRNGYMHVTIQHNYKQKTFLVHRLVANAFIPNSNGKPEINHKDGNKQNNSVENLEWVTSKENKRHGMRTGLYDLDKMRKGAERMRTPEAIRKMAISLGKPVIRSDGKIYASAADASRALGRHKGEVSKQLHGARGAIDGYTFEYYEKD